MEDTTSTIVKRKGKAKSGTEPCDEGGSAGNANGCAMNAVSLGKRATGDVLGSVPPTTVGRGMIHDFTTEFRRFYDNAFVQRGSCTKIIFSIVLLLVMLSGIFVVLGSLPLVVMSAEDSLSAQMALSLELQGVKERLESQDRRYLEARNMEYVVKEDLQSLQMKVVHLMVELRELKDLDQAAQTGSSGDANMITMVSRTNKSLKDTQESMFTALTQVEKQLERQKLTIEDAVKDVGVGVDRRRDLYHSGLDAMEGEELLLREMQGVLDSIVISNDKVMEQVHHLKDASAALVTKEFMEESLWGAVRSEGVVGTVEGGGIEDLVEAAVVRCPVEVGGGGGEQDEGCIGVEEVEGVVKEAVNRLWADGTGMRDYALASMGASLVMTENRMSDSYLSPEGEYQNKYLSKLWHSLGIENGLGPPSSVLSEDTRLSSCWAMKGNSGLVTIRLTADIAVHGVSIEHTSRHVALDMSSAPRQFEVYGLRDADDSHPVTLGVGEYIKEGKAVQFFEFEPVGRKYPMVTFNIRSNWGNSDYTCIYRLRVHGEE